MMDSLRRAFDRLRAAMKDAFRKPATAGEGVNEPEQQQRG
jgi:hypothetical protein